MDRKTAFGLRLREIRKAHGLSQEQFAELLERSPEAVSNMERGANYPSLETLFRLSDTLSIPLADLFAALDTTDRDRRRVQLESELAETARLLPLRDLEIAVDQLRAFTRARK